MKRIATLILIAALSFAGSAVAANSSWENPALGNNQSFEYNGN